MTLNPAFRKLLILAPAGARLPRSLRRRGKLSRDTPHYEERLRELQTLRGSIYLEDGAIHSSQLREGCHVAESDRKSWHLLVLDKAGRVSGCVRYREHASDVSFSDLTAAQSSLASSPDWGGRVRAAVENELLLAEALSLPFVEIGGWALSAQIRGTVEALRMVLAAYAFSRQSGGAVGLATATVRHSSASILRRIGGRSLRHGGEDIPAYSDRHYHCDMEMLRFHSWALNPRYDTWVDDIAHEVRQVAVVAPAVAEIAPMRPRAIAAGAGDRLAGFAGRIREAMASDGAGMHSMPAIAHPGVK